MAMEQTFAIIKPDAVGRGLAGDIIKRIEASGLKIRGMRLMHLSQARRPSAFTKSTRRGRFTARSAST